MHRRLCFTTIVVLGVVGFFAYLKSAELYDPMTHSFAATGQLSTPRAGHEAVLLTDGRVLIVGGVGLGWSFLASAEIYDPRTQRFTATGAMQEARASHAAVRLRDGRVLVVGGHRGRGSAIVISRTAEVYDPATGRFSPTDSMRTRRHKHDALALGDGRVMVSGGADERDNEGVYSNVESFDPATNRFRVAGSMRVGRYKHRGTGLLLPTGVVLLAGGATQAEEYDASSERSVLVSSDVRMAGQFSAAALLRDGRVLITGGYGHNSGPRTNAWMYEPNAQRPR